MNHAPDRPRNLVPALVAMLAMLAMLAAGSVAAQDPDEEIQSLRERLTEREDENRLSEPISVDVAGRPLILSGELELAFDDLEQTTIEPSGRERLVFEPEIEVEAFYAFSPRLSAFVQLRAGTAQAWTGDSPDHEGGYVERGETWIYLQDLGGFDFEIGRLEFEDDRLWWWDEDLDALRLTREWGKFELEAALAREVAAVGSYASYIDPEHAGVRRLIVESSWDWHAEHTLQGFALVHDDDSHTEQPGDLVAVARADESDAALRWFGLRAAGALDAGRRGQLAYWVDLARVRGSELVIELGDPEDGAYAVDEVLARQVRGWAVDAGVTWAFQGPAEPRLSIGYARGSGDRDPDDDFDHAFRQTGLEANEIGFGGVQRFAHYGLVLDPELSNMSILTLGVGCSLLAESSIDLVYNRYRMVERSGDLRELRLDAEPDGSHADVGEAFDLVLAIEEWERFELDLRTSVFKPGPAFGDERSGWIWGGVLAFRMAF